MRSRVRALADPHGSFLAGLVYHDVRDRLSGRSAIANARWGRLARPAQAGRPVWICAGATRSSVRLAVELARAIVARRLDVTVTLTYEVEFPELLEALRHSVRISWGFGPADYAPSINSVWRRLTPFALVVAGTSPRRNLLAAAAGARHALLVAPPQPVSGPFERIYPTHAAPCPGANSAPAADLDTLLVEPPAGADLAEAIGGPRRLWWWHGADAGQAMRFIALFRGHLPGERLVLSGPICRAFGAETAVLRLSAWEGTAISADTLLLADESRWYPAVAACCAGAHFAAAEADALWQALAAGACASTAGSVDVAGPQLLGAATLLDDVNDIALSWAALRADPRAARIAAEASRRAFRTERRLAQEAIAEMLERVLAWS